MLHEFRLSPSAAPGWDTFAEQVSNRLPQMRDGLYVFFFTNDLTEVVRDNNRGREKTVIHAAGASLKPGKFEGGLVRRMAEYQAHLHWVDTLGRQNWVFTQCFRFGILLDLSQCDLGLPSSARVFERYWIDSVNQFIDKERLWAPIRQLARSEWNYIEASGWSAEVERRLRDFMHDRADRILKMAAVAGSPSGTVP
ncbi:hypothetical protein WMF11_38985 [Sorangium sp. So ce295]|uniref:hypothetical protein n=1 Tax=Sorangium sp. So ce295 TaxID=3133295 RepID=UPI003F637E87